MATPTRIVDPDRFLLFAALIDWIEVQQRTPGSVSASQILVGRDLTNPRMLHLRWVPDPRLGYPSEPFRVWRRPAMPIEGEAKVTPTVLTLPFGWTGYALPTPVVYLRMTLNVAGPTASILAYSGAPFGSALVGMETVATGFRTFSFSAGRIVSIVVFGAAALVDLTAIDGDAAQADKGWQLVELVGLPVDPTVWSGVRRLDRKQGTVPPSLDPRDAARDRYRRGAPFYGWQPSMQPGRPAPPWSLADPDAILKAYDSDMLPDLRTIIAGLPPEAQRGFTRDATLPLDGGLDDATTTYAPLDHLVFAAATDPLANLIGGFGTAYENEDIPPIVLGDRTLFGDKNRSDWDWMVTALYEKGLDDRSEPVEYAAIVRAPPLATPPPPPFAPDARTDGMRSPAARDQPWFPVIRLGWDKLPDTLPFRAASYAAARAVNPPNTPSTPLMGTRRFDEATLQPISATTSPEQGAVGRLAALDEALALPAAPSPFPLVYGIAHQDLFGLWSSWAAVAHQAAEPATKIVPILSARLEMAVPPGPGPVAARLVVEFSWDWEVRSPKEFRFVGRLYPQADLGDGPPVPGVPAGLQRSLGGPAGVPFVVRFNGGNAGTPDAGGTLRYVAIDLPTRPLRNTPVPAAGTRLYQLTIEGFSLDFNAAPRIGLALSAMMQENRPPQRIGPWSERPAIASTADPRPPVITVVREDVPMASLADASGLHHATLAWPAFPGATGYNVYTVAESRLRADLGLAEAPQHETLSQRLAALRTAFRANPLRAPFAKLNDKPLAGTRAPVVLPRGTKEIHLYAVLGVSAGNVETAWPDLGDALREKRLFAFAAPQIVAPSPPRLEVRRVPLGNGFRAQVVLRASPGATAARLALFRTRVPEASLTLATMGPPIATFPTADPAWMIQAENLPGAPPQPLGRIEGQDAPAGSWLRVFYRAFAEASDDPARGLYGGRSAASGAQEVIVPPAGPPNLSALSSSVGGGGLDVTVTATTIAPVEATPLGPHRLRLEAHRAAPSTGLLTPLFAWPPTPTPPAAPDDRLEAVRTSAVPPGGQGVRRTTAGSGTTTLSIVLRRPLVSEALRLRVMLTDPLGRATERVLEVPAAVQVPPPDIDGLVMTKVPGKGFVLAFTTPAPRTTTPIGDYTLAVSWRLTPVLLPVPGLGGRLARTATVTRTLAAIAAPRPVEDLFADLEAIPLRKRRADPPMGTEVTLVVRGASGAIGISLTAPDGRVQTLSRSLR